MSSPVTAAEEEVSSLRQALQQQNVTVKTLPNVVESTTVGEPASVFLVSRNQSYIWTSIILAVVLFFTAMALLNMDAGQEKDTILYAKFLRVDDGIRNWSLNIMFLYK